MTCPVCCSNNFQLYDQDKVRNYFKCQGCSLIFIDRNSLISPILEKERYEAHENSEANRGYRDYLSGIAKSVKPHLKIGQVGLDFGSGKTKILSELLSPHIVQSYDLFFFPEHDLLERHYDFILLSEVIEHLRDPLRVMKELKNCLNPGGQFFIKTKFYPKAQKDFSHWFYKRDITHIQFFNERSLEKLCSLLGLGLVLQVGDDLYLVR